eukprot:13087860-Heterocapsa_arctica.AAC.1
MMLVPTFCLDMRVVICLVVGWLVVLRPLWSGLLHWALVMAVCRAPGMLSLPLPVIMRMNWTVCAIISMHIPRGRPFPESPAIICSLSPRCCACRRP